MSFTPLNNPDQSNGVPEITTSMRPMHTDSHYQSDNMERAVTIGLDGRPIGGVADTPPFDLLSPDNAARMRQAKALKEAQARRAEQNSVPATPSAPINVSDVLAKAKGDLVGRAFSYITSEKFGEVVNVVDCSVDQSSMIVLHMSDGFRTTLEDLEVNFIPSSSTGVSPQSIPAHQYSPPVQNTIPVNRSTSSLPSSPLQDLLKSRKRNSASMDIELTLDLVKTDFFKIIDDSYENAIDYVVEHVMNSITLDDVRSAVKHKLIGIYGIVEGSVNDQIDGNTEDMIYRDEKSETIILEADKSSK